MKKKITVFIVCLLLFAMAVSIPVSAAAITLISDETDSIDSVDLNRLENFAETLGARYGIYAGYMLTAIDNSTDKTLSQYAHEKHPEEGFNGFILVHDLNLKLWTVAYFGKAAEYASDDLDDRLWSAYCNGNTFVEGLNSYLYEAENYIIEQNIGTSAGPVPDAPQVIRNKEDISLLMDEAGLLSKDDAAELRRKLEQLSDKWDNDIVIVTVNSLGGNSPMEFADDWFDYNGYGRSNSGDITQGDGLLLLISMEERDYWISTKGYAISVFTDAGIAYLGDHLISDGLSSGDYANAFNNFADNCDRFYTQAKNSRPYDTGNMPQAKRSLSDYVLLLIICSIIGFIVGSIITAIKKRQLRSVRTKTTATDYLRPGSFQLTNSFEQFLFRHVTSVYNPPSSSSSGGGGSSSHSSSSGSSHGGGGGKF